MSVLCSARWSVSQANVSNAQHQALSGQDRTLQRGRNRGHAADSLRDSGTDAARVQGLGQTSGLLRHPAGRLCLLGMPHAHAPLPCSRSALDMLLTLPHITRPTSHSHRHHHTARCRVSQSSERFKRTTPGPIRTGQDTPTRAEPWPRGGQSQETAAQTRRGCRA